MDFVKSMVFSATVLLGLAYIIGRPDHLLDWTIGVLMISWGGWQLKRLGDQ